MPTPTYDLIASSILGSNTQSITISSIPSTYRDLVVVVTGQLSNVDTDYDWLRFNGDSAGNYSGVAMRGDGVSTSSSAWSANPATQLWVDASASGITNSIKTVIFQIMDYSATDKHKTVLIRSSSPTQIVTATAARWASTSAINQILYRPNSGTLATGTSLYLYGIVS